MVDGITYGAALTMPMYSVGHIQVVMHCDFQDVSFICLEEGSWLLVVDQVHQAGESIWEAGVSCT